MKAFANRIIVLLVLLFLCDLSCSHGDEQDQVAPKIILRSLALLEQQFRASSEAQSKAKSGKQILDIGRPLLEGSMRRSNARIVAEALKSGAPLPDELKGYFGFWLLRAVAAVAADDRDYGCDAANVLQRLDATNSQKDAVVDVVAALNIKGWLDKADRLKGWVDKKFDSTAFDAEVLLSDAQMEEFDDPDDGVRRLTAAITLQRDNPEFYYWRGRIKSEHSASKEDIEQAIQDFTTAIRLKSDDIVLFRDSYLRRGLCYEIIGDDDRALQDYTHLFKMGRPWVAYFQLARLFVSKGDYKRSTAELSAALKAEPNMSSMWHALLGALHTREGAYDSAIQDFSDGIKSAEVERLDYRWNNLCLARLRATCPKTKFRDGTRAVSLAKKTVEDEFSGFSFRDGRAFPLDTLAAAYAEAGSFEDAAKTEELAIKALKANNQHFKINDSNLPEYEARLNLYKNKQPYRETGEDVIHQLRKWMR